MLLCDVAVMLSEVEDYRTHMNELVARCPMHVRTAKYLSQRRGLQFLYDLESMEKLQMTEKQQAQAKAVCGWQPRRKLREPGKDDRKSR